MWDLRTDEDESMIAESVREYLGQELPVERLRPRAPPCDTAKARAGMVDLGWLGIGLPEEIGGSGLGLAAELIIQREMGRFLVSPAILATILGAHVAHHSGDAALARDMLTGRAGAALTMFVDEQSRPHSAYAFDWNGADMLLVWNDDGMGLVDASRFAQSRLCESIDDSLSMHEGIIQADQAKYWVPSAQAPLALHGQLLLAANLVGLAAAACDLAVEYAKVREQFGKPIGSFQAVKHRCADMTVRATLSWHQARFACLKLNSGAHDAPLQAAAAKLVAAEAAHRNGQSVIQVHGGIGFQSECDAHWYMKRAHIYDRAGGAAAMHAQRIARAPSPLW